MKSKLDVPYLKKRAQQETAIAAGSLNPQLKRIHEGMAEAYKRLAEERLASGCPMPGRD